MPTKANWEHRTLVLGIGAGRYTFRTLSLLRVWQLWPHVGPWAEALAKSKPLAYAQKVEEMLRIVCPELYPMPEQMKRMTREEIDELDCSQLKPVHIDCLIEFYSAQDWSRIKALGEETSGNTDAPPVEGEEIDRTNVFILLCIAAARFAEMSLAEFMNERFEFCADVILALHQSTDEKDKKLTPDQFFTVMKAVLPGQKLDPDNRPAWVGELEAALNVRN